jgi:hypothetical protein
MTGDIVQVDASNPDPRGLLAKHIRTLLDEAGIPRAKWDKAGNVIQDGYDVMGVGVSVRYVDEPHVRAQHEAKIEEIMAVLKEYFDRKIMEIGGSRWRIAAHRTTDSPYTWPEIDVDMFWKGYL